MCVSADMYTTPPCVCHVVFFPFGPPLRPHRCFRPHLVEDPGGRSPPWSLAVTRLSQHDRCNGAKRPSVTCRIHLYSAPPNREWAVETMTSIHVEWGVTFLSIMGSVSSNSHYMSLHPFLLCKISLPRPLIPAMVRYHVAGRRAPVQPALGLLPLLDQIQQPLLLLIRRKTKRRT